MPKFSQTKHFIFVIMLISIGFWGCEEKSDDPTSDLVGTWYLIAETWGYLITTNSVQTFASTINANNSVTLTGSVNYELPFWFFSGSEDGSYFIIGEGLYVDAEIDLEVTISNNDTTAVIYIIYDEDSEETYYCSDPVITWNPTTLAFTITNSVFTTHDGTKSITADGLYNGSYIDVPANTPTLLEIGYEEFGSMSLTLNDNGTYETDEPNNGTWEVEGSSIILDGEEYLDFELDGSELILSSTFYDCKGDTECLSETEGQFGFDSGSLTAASLIIELIFSKNNPNTMKMQTGRKKTVYFKDIIKTDDLSQIKNMILMK